MVQEDTRVQALPLEVFPLSRWGEGRDVILGNSEQNKVVVEVALTEDPAYAVASWRVGWVSDARRVINYLFPHKT